MLLVGLALFVELVEDRGEQRRDHLKGVERAASRAGRGDDECARGVARGHADDLSGQTRQWSVGEAVGADLLGDARDLDLDDRADNLGRVVAHAET